MPAPLRSRLGQRSDDGMSAVWLFQNLIHNQTKSLPFKQALISSPSSRDQLGMGPFFGDFAFIEDQNTVEHADGGKSMGDDDGGSPGHKPFNGFLDERFGFGVETGGGFVQNEHGCVGEEGSGERDSLTFSPAEFDAAFPHKSRVTFGLAADELMRVRQARRFFNFFEAGAGSGVGYVFCE